MSSSALCLSFFGAEDDLLGLVNYHEFARTPTVRKNCRKRAGLFGGVTLRAQRGISSSDNVLSI